MAVPLHLEDAKMFYWSQNLICSFIMQFLKSLKLYNFYSENKLNQFEQKKKYNG